MDYFQISIFLKLSKIKASNFRKVLASAIGALYTIIIIRFPIANELIENLFTYVIIVILMLVIVVGRVDFVRFVRYMITFYIVVFLVGGVANAIYYNTVVGYVLSKMDKGYIIILATIILAKGIFFCIFEFLREHKIYAGKIYNVTFEWKGVTISTKALYDTGNTLRDVYYRRPVSIIEKGLMLEEEQFTAEEMVDFKYHIIPFNSLGKSHGLIEVIEVKNMIIYKEDKKIEIGNTLVGLYKGKLSTDNNYSMLLNSVIFNEKGEK